MNGEHLRWKGVMPENVASQVSHITQIFILLQNYKLKVENKERCNTSSSAAHTYHINGTGGYNRIKGLSVIMACLREKKMV